ncbi:MAG: hypothetical protein FWH26_07110 [Oscillospiraceae bacterium]|nr:hypothetical protein [Oscillospiraceae bacterium]
MIPRVIHYCWFGGKEKPRLVRLCMESWRRFAPDFELREWNEESFDPRSVPFAKDAYADGNYAFVSDYARAKALFEEGGVYLDTDVELLRPIESFLADALFAGFEAANFVGTAVIGSEPGHALWMDYLRHYDSVPYWDENGRPYSGTNVTLFTALLQGRGLRTENRFQRLGDICVYPSDRFSPYDYCRGVTRLTEHSVAVHHFARLWLPRRVRLRRRLKRLIGPVLSLWNGRKDQ